MSFTISVTAATTAGNSPMQFVAAVTTAAAEENGQALLWSTSTLLTTWLNDSTSTAAEVTTVGNYTDGYAAAFSYTIMASKLATGTSGITVAAGDVTVAYGACFHGTEDVTTNGTTTTTAATSCAGYEWNFNNSADVANMTVTNSMVQYHSTDNSNTIDTSATEWTATTAVSTATGGSWVCQLSGATYPITGVEVTTPQIMACQRFLPKEAASAATDMRYEPTVSGGFSGGIKTFKDTTLTVSAITSLTGAFQAATVAGAVALAALTF